ncbi:glycosyltransferase [Caminibacter mediatlanticus TB-2]|uniref:Glycosyltransferase n=1 Tax=Caminibacter mediatlanticus TB-2 TaxID=391592 RepID=A0ABX5V6S3_9BACT|nr:glycosyltransferase [Caminibacter mediatlanticus]QCT93963.1 glycosyltransferase [Caminibacter mediatlanticus TB-2]
MSNIPILIFSYIRLNELKLTIESLLNNKDIDKYYIFIFNDYVKNLDDKNKMIQVRRYIENLEKEKKFKNLKIIFREENYGLAKNIIEGVTEIINIYGKVIVLEDDLILSNNFLCYMKKALNHYEDDENIFSISGYTMPLKRLENYEYDSYLALRPSSWGWATWKDRWNKVDWDVSDFNNFIKNRDNIKAFNKGGVDLSRMLKHYMKGKNNSWAIRWAYGMFKNGQYCVYPKISKVQNIGFGLNATHCKGINIYKTKLDNTNKCNFRFVKNLIDEQILKEFKYQYSYQNKLIKRIKYYFGKFFNED